MYFKVSGRHNPHTNKPGWYYRLVESYRNADDRVCHRTMLNVGFLEGLTTDQMNLIQKMLTQRCENTNNKKQKIELCRVKSEKKHGLLSQGRK